MIFSTGGNFTPKEAARCRKYIQYSSDKLVYFDPALKMWYKEYSFYHGNTLRLHSGSDDHVRYATETALIRTLCPELSPSLGGQS